MNFSDHGSLGVGRLASTGRDLDGGSDALVRPATADVAGHGVVDILVGRLGLFLEQRGSLHHLPALAITALGDVNLPPGALDRMVALEAESFDCSNRFGSHV